MTPEQFTQALAQLGLKQADYARLIDVSQKTIWMWVSGRTPVPKLASEHLSLLMALDDLHRRYLGRPDTVEAPISALADGEAAGQGEPAA